MGSCPSLDQLPKIVDRSFVLGFFTSMSMFKDFTACYFNMKKGSDETCNT